MIHTTHPWYNLQHLFLLLQVTSRIGLNIFILKQAYIQHAHNKLQVDWVGSRSLLEPSPRINYNC